MSSLVAFFVVCKYSKTFVDSILTSAVIVFPLLVVLATLFSMTYLVSSLLYTGEDTLFQNIIAIPLRVPEVFHKITESPREDEEKFPNVSYEELFPRTPFIMLKEHKEREKKEDLRKPGYNEVDSSGDIQNVEVLILEAQDGEYMGEVDDEN